MPKLTGDVLGYVMKEGIFKRFCAAAKVNKDKPFVLIIDEINRADLSSVFGELMYALEYREEEVSIPHFGPFVIPENVYVIGTMNNTDKSLVTFDLALRRRFLFFKLMPDMTALNDWNAKEPPPTDGKVLSPIDDGDLKSLIDRAEKLNKAIAGKGPKELGLSEDYGIGQAYFMKIYDFCAEEPETAKGEGPRRRIKEFDRERLWIYHLKPLLDEYIGAEVEDRMTALEAMRDDFVKGA
jgi:5-methylcytosine-specific restriction endonuclease McrBC GTP-binding regulatory subunit McrB